MRLERHQCWYLQHLRRLANIDLGQIFILMSAILGHLVSRTLLGAQHHAWGSKQSVGQGLLCLCLPLKPSLVIVDFLTLLRLVLPGLVIEVGDPGNGGFCLVRVPSLNKLR